MNKRGHLMITEAAAGSSVTGVNRFALMLGCILPDLLVHTYLKGHTWKGSRDSMEDMLSQLEKQGSMNFISFLRLGYVMHYIEDYFTFPHNENFHKGFFSHVAYERKLSRFIRKDRNALAEVQPGCPLSAELLSQYINQKHEYYLKQEPCETNDIGCMMPAASRIIQSCVMIFANHEAEREHIALPLNVHREGRYL